MQIIISVGGKHHAFYLAQQLLKRGYLKKLITSYPKFQTRKYGIPDRLVKSKMFKSTIDKIWNEFIPDSLKKKYDIRSIINIIYDKQVIKYLEKCDIFVGFWSTSLFSFKKVKELGVIKILDRGGAHIEFTHQILKEEYARFGLRPHFVQPGMIRREIDEYAEADYISIPSSFVKRTFIKKGISENKLILVPYGVDLSQFRQISKEDKIFRVVFAGGLTIIPKGVHYLLQAFYELKLPKSELLLIGKIYDEIKPFLKKYNYNLKVIGHKPQNVLHRYYSQGSVFVMPSLYEGFGMVLVQAMACGLPLICTTNTAGEDLIEKGKEGFVIPIRDVEALKEKILFFYENQDTCYQMGQAAKRKVQKGFTWDDYGKKMVSEYRRILSNQIT